jgi:hypothetical protein
MRLGLPVVLTVSLAASTAYAQPVTSATRASARLLAEEGIALSDKGDCAGAVEKLTRAHDMVRVSTLALYAGKCLKRLGRWVDAGEWYLTATRDEVEPGAPAAQRRAQEDAAAARAALLPRIPTVELVLDVTAVGASVALDGRVLLPAEVGVPRPIDPGKHVVEVKRGEATATRDLVVEESAHERVVLALSGATTGPVAPSATPAEAPSPGPWVVGGVGAAGLVVGAVAGVLVLQANGTYKNNCNSTKLTCPTRASLNAVSTVQTLGPVTTVGLVVGGAGVLAGGLWLGLRPSPKGAARVGVTSVAGGAGGAVWRVEGSW